MTQLITASYPSNIALVKYWGKREPQLPCNASLSLTLDKARTEVRLFLSEKQRKEIEFSYYFEGRLHETFGNRIVNYLKEQPLFLELLNKHAIRIESENTFPHSAGIASSASAFAAVAAAFLKAAGVSVKDFKREVSRLSRLGSGSACRSSYGPFAMWGRLKDFPESSDEFAVPVLQIHDCFKEMKDAILIVEEEAKKVSSSTGHALMNGHPLAIGRFRQANRHCLELLSALKHGDFDIFISITEREALSLHAMMMTSKDYYMLMKPDTLRMMDQISVFRKETGLPVCFSLDAGPNVHMLYPKAIQGEVDSFLKNNILDSLKSVVFDQAGKGGTVI